MGSEWMVCSRKPLKISVRSPAARPIGPLLSFSVWSVSLGYGDSGGVSPWRFLPVTVAVLLPLCSECLRGGDCPVVPIVCPATGGIFYYVHALLSRVRLALAQVE